MQQAAQQQAYYQGMANAAAAQNVYGLAQQAGVGNNLFGAMGAYPWANVSAMPLPSVLAEPEKPLPVEIKAGELVAWRIWLMKADGTLTSTAVDTVWEEGKVIEGNVDAGVGVHAWKTEAQARAFADSYRGMSLAIGSIELWGQVIEHDEGYRAQYGQIKEIVERVVATPRPPTRNQTYHQLVYGATPPTPSGVSPVAVWVGIGAGLVVGAAIMATVSGPVAFGMLLVGGIMCAMPLVAALE